MNLKPHRPDQKPLVLLVCLLAGCLLDNEPKEIAHPTSQNLPPPGSPTIRPLGMPRELERRSLHDWMKTRDALLATTNPLASLGHEGGIGDPPPDLFASELDIALDSIGNIFVLDRGNHSVKIFGPAGAAIASFGRSGEGPMEFRDPSALERLSDGRLVVTERSNRLKVFLPTHLDHEYEYAATHTTGIVADYGCSLGNRVFVSGKHRDNNTILHEVQLHTNEMPRSFGRGYEDDYWLVQDQLSSGPIACFDHLGLVLFAFQNLPVVKAYSVDTGNLVWTALLEGYIQPPIVEESRPDGTGRIVFDGRGVRDRVLLLSAVSSQHALLQTARYEPVLDPGANAAIDALEVRSYLLDAATGQGAYISESLPLIPTVDPTHQFYAAVWLLPFPRVELRKLNLAEPQVTRADMDQEESSW